MRSIWVKNKLILASLLILVVVAVLLWRELSSGQGRVAGTRHKPSALNLVVPKRVAVNQPFEVLVTIDTLGNKINAAGVFLEFEPERLQLINLDTRQSFCQFYPEKKFDNRLGTVRLSCGAPHPGFEGTNTIMRLEFNPLVVGTTTLRTRPQSQLLLSDGKGTNVIQEYPQAEIGITAGF